MECDCRTGLYFDADGSEEEQFSYSPLILVIAFGIHVNYLVIKRLE